MSETARALPGSGLTGRSGPATLLNACLKQMVKTRRAPGRPGRRGDPPRRPRDPDATREALLAAASELFGADGFDATRVEAIARRAGVNKALINYHFGGKRRLYLAVLESTFAEFVAEAERLAAAPRPPDELLRAFVAAFAEMATRRRPNFPAMLLREVLGGGRLVDQAILPRLRAIFGAVRSIVERGVSEGRFRPVDPVLTHLGLIGSLVFFFATAAFRSRLAAEGKIPFVAPPAEAYVRHIQHLMTRGLAAGAPDEGARMPAC